jgi:DNA-binding XRE family transcriptional regulator
MTKDQLNKRIGRYLKRTRLTQDEIAKVLDVPRTAITMIESGERAVSAFEALKICQLVYVEPNELFNWSDEKDN